MTWTISLIILFIIYIPIIYFIAKKGKKFVVKIVLIILALISMPIACVIIIYNFPYYYLAPFEGRVIDVDTKTPVSGAAVLAVYHKEVPSIGMGSNSYAVDAQETLTDKNGEFKIPEYIKWFGSNNGEPEGNLIIFKPGYGKFPGSKGTRAVGVSDTWPPPEKYIVYEIPKLKTREDRKNNVIWMHKYMKPLYIQTINEERKNLGLELITMSEEEIWK